MIVFKIIGKMQSQNYISEGTKLSLLYAYVKKRS